MVFGNVTTGAANDIEQATNIVTNMITRFGMSKRFGLMGLATVESEYLGGGAKLTCSDRTAADVDTEIMETLKQCYEEAKEMLSGNREVMDKLAAHLIEKETISGKEFMKIYREAKGIPEPEEPSSTVIDSDPEKTEDIKTDTDAEMQEEDKENMSVPETMESASDEGKATVGNDGDAEKQQENVVTGRFSNTPSDFLNK